MAKESRKCYTRTAINQKWLCKTVGQQRVTHRIEKTPAERGFNAFPRRKTLKPLQLKSSDKVAPRPAPRRRRRQCWGVKVHEQSEISWLRDLCFAAPASSAACLTCRRAENDSRLNGRQDKRVLEVSGLFQPKKSSWMSSGSGMGGVFLGVFFFFFFGGGGGGGAFFFFGRFSWFSLAKTLLTLHFGRIFCHFP